MLVSSAGVTALGVVTARRQSPSAKYFVGEGKAFHFGFVGAYCHFNVEAWLAVEHYGIFHVAFFEVFLIEGWPLRITHCAFVAEHVDQTCDRLVETSQAVRDAVEAGRTAVVGLTYSLAGGTAQPGRVLGALQV